MYMLTSTSKLVIFNREFDKKKLVMYPNESKTATSN